MESLPTGTLVSAQILELRTMDQFSDFFFFSELFTNEVRSTYKFGLKTGYISMIDTVKTFQ